MCHNGANDNMQSCSRAPGDRTIGQFVDKTNISGLVCNFLALTCFERLALLESTSYLNVGGEMRRRGQWGQKGRREESMQLENDGG